MAGRGSMPGLALLRSASLPASPSANPIYARPTPPRPGEVFSCLSRYGRWAGPAAPLVARGRRNTIISRICKREKYSNVGRGATLSVRRVMNLANTIKGVSPVSELREAERFALTRTVLRPLLCLLLKLGVRLKGRRQNGSVHIEQEGRGILETQQLRYRHWEIEPTEFSDFEDVKTSILSRFLF